MRRWLLLVFKGYLARNLGRSLWDYVCPRVIYYLASIQGCKPLLLSDLSLFIGPRITVWVHFPGQFYSLMSLCSRTRLAKCDLGTTLLYILSLSYVTSLNIFYWIWMLTNPPLDYIFFLYSKCLQNFKIIWN